MKFETRYLTVVIQTIYGDIGCNSLVAILSCLLHVLLEKFTCIFYTDTQCISLKADDVNVRNLGRIFAVSTTMLWYGHMMVASASVGQT